MMTRFRRDYLDLLDGRVAKIRELIAGRQLEPAHVALLSLESSSAMMGRSELVTVVRQLRLALDQGDQAALDQLVQEMAGLAREVRVSLERRPG